MSWELHEGDCLEIMPTLPDKSVDAVITDPPYMIGAISAGNANSKAGTWADMENSAHWFAAWMKECKRLLKRTGYLLTFGNWRSIPTFIRALSLAGLPATSCMVWDKEWIGPSGPAQLRPRYEVIVFSAMSDARIDDRSAADIIKCKWNAGHMKTTENPAEKPAALMKRLCELVTNEGDMVLDPFAGSGTTLVAAVESGRRAIGIERERMYCEAIRERMADRQQTIFEKGATP